MPLFSTSEFTLFYWSQRTGAASCSGTCHYNHVRLGTSASPPTSVNGFWVGLKNTGAVDESFFVITGGTFGSGLAEIPETFGPVADKGNWIFMVVRWKSNRCFAYKYQGGPSTFVPEVDYFFTLPGGSTTLIIGGGFEGSIEDVISSYFLLIDFFT